MELAEVKQKYLETIRMLNIGPNRAQLNGGGALVVYGLRNWTEKLMIDVPPATLTLLKFTDERETFKDNGQEVMCINGNVELRVIRDTRITRDIDGICCYSPESLLRQLHKRRKIFGRGFHTRLQCAEDIERLNAFIRTNRR